MCLKMSSHRPFSLQGVCPAVGWLAEGSAGSAVVGPPSPAVGGECPLRVPLARLQRSLCFPFSHRSVYGVVPLYRFVISW